LGEKNQVAAFEIVEKKKEKREYLRERNEHEEREGRREGFKTTFVCFRTIPPTPQIKYLPPLKQYKKRNKKGWL